ncbi:COPII subunit, variant 2 [Mucor circinelloides]
MMCIALLYQQQTSYHDNNQPKKSSRRLYPINEHVQPMQQSNSKRQQYAASSAFSHDKALDHLSRMSIASPVTVNKGFDVPLLGNAPLISDFELPLPTPRIPASASVTMSDHAQCASTYQRCTLNAIPYNNSLLKKSKLPLSLLLEPYPRTQPQDKHNLHQVPVISHGTISRCTRCKSFINPFIQFIEGGLKWQCNICGHDDNNVPPAYDWDHITRQKADRWSTPELNYGCVDYMATSEFMSRPPQPPVYVFVIDTTKQAISTGMIPVLAEALIASIDHIPNSDGRARVGFITVSHAIGFYGLGNKEPELLMMPDIDDIYLPRAHADLVVNLNEAKSAVLDLLERLKVMFTNEACATNDNCLGAALKAARQLLSPTGGKIICFQASLPNIGIGALSSSVIHKQNTNAAGENLLLEPTSEFYRSFSEECTKSHVCADMFVFGSQNIDVATLNVIPRFTGGQTHYYPGFNASNMGDREKLKLEIMKLVPEEIGLEAIVRTKCSPGLACKLYHGNFSFQLPDILVLPNVPRDASYCIDLSIEKELQGDLAYFQTCMLYTSSAGERFIRVMTTCLPVTRKITELFYAVDQQSAVRAMAFQALDKAVTLKIRDGKEYLAQKTMAICNAYSKEVVGIVPSKSAQLNVCRSLSLLPAMMLALLKSEAFNDTGVVPTNIATQSGILLRTLPARLWSRYVYPTFYSLHNMPLHAGTFDANGKCIMPPAVNLSSEKLERHGCYLVENGQRILIWIGKEAVPQLCSDLLNVPQVSQVKSGQIPSLPVLNNPFSERIGRILKCLRTDLRHCNFYPSLYVVREDGEPMLCSWFMTHMLEDRQHLASSSRFQKTTPYSAMSYYQWLGHVKEGM